MYGPFLNMVRTEEFENGVLVWEVAHGSDDVGFHNEVTGKIVSNYLMHLENDMKPILAHSGN